MCNTADRMYPAEGSRQVVAADLGVSPAVFEAASFWQWNGVGPSRHP